jgi:hypothetical protein
MELFEHDYGTASKEIDETDITTTLLYFSTEELKEFKKLSKKGIKELFGADYLEKGNLSDLLLHLLREKYGTPTAQSATSDNSKEETN